MLNITARNWWLLALRGLLAIIFGLTLFVYPGLALQALITVFAVYALIDGILTIMNALGQREHNSRWWVNLLEGVIGVVAGVVALLLPGITALALLYLIAFWAIATGVMQILTAIELRHVIKNEVLLGMAGAASILFGLLIALFPGSGALAILWLIGGYSIVFGLLLIMLAFRVRGMRIPFDQQATVPSRQSLMR